MITASLHQAAAAGRDIYVHPRPKTLSQARNNLRAFCDEAATRPQPKDFVPIDSDPRIVACLGWTEFKGSDINEHFRRARVGDQESKIADETYPAIVYEFVADDGIPVVDNIMAQLDFFHMTGFMTVSFNENNWRGRGVLVDFCDIVPHHTGYMWWRPSYYAEQQPGWCRQSVERAAEGALLGPRPKPSEEPRHYRSAHRYSGAGVRYDAFSLRPSPPPPPFRNPPPGNRGHLSQTGRFGEVRASHDGATSRDGGNEGDTQSVESVRTGQPV
jgi:hypothetical protein